MADDNRDEASGQFTPAEPLTGQAGVEAAAGFKPMPGEAAVSEDESLTLSEATESRAEGGDTAKVVERNYVDGDGKPAGVDERGKITETLSVERAAQDLTALRQAEFDHVGRSISKDFAEAVDALRADRHKGDPAVAEHYSVEVPTADAPPVDAKPGEEPPAAAEGDLDADLERALNHPRIKAALENQISENYEVQQQHAKGVKAAVEYAALAFADQFPEFATIPQEQWQTALAMLNQTNPGRAAMVANYIGRANQIAARHEHLTREQEMKTQREFREYAKAEDAKFEAIAPNVGPEIVSEIRASLKESGIEPAEFWRLTQSDKTLRSSFAQKTMWEAAQYRLMKAAPARAVP